MLIHPEVKALLDYVAPESTVTGMRESATSLSFNNSETDGFVSLHYNHEMLEPYQRDTRGQMMTTDQAKMRVHAIKPGTFAVDLNDKKSFLMFLTEVTPDIIQQGDVFPVSADLVNGLMSEESTKDLAKNLPDLQFSKRTDGAYHADVIKRQFDALASTPFREYFKHVFYVRGVRKWGIFIDFQGAKYSLFF